MVEEEHTDPLEVTKDPLIVKAAQTEISKLDILVCGECHEVFHFIESFQEHRLQNKCSKESTLKEYTQNESKSQVWGFMLWKNAKFKNTSEDSTPPTSWTVYQLWCNLEQSQKETWVTAGKSLQTIHTISTSKLQPATKTLMKPTKSKVSMYKKDDDEEFLEEGEVRINRKGKRSANDSEQDPLADSDSDFDIEEELERERMRKCENGGVKKTILKPVQLNSDVTILPSTKRGTSKKAIRSNNEDKKVEYVVEKIISKRYNPGKKTHEYLIKWEDFDEQQNTWEPLSHLESCKQLVEEFDRNLQKLKAQKLTKSPLVHRRPYKRNLPEHNADLILSTGVGRPQRTSKQKALNQVKVWCGNMSDAEEGSGKRAFSDSDSDSFEKKIKLEAESTDSEEDKPMVTVKRVMKTSLNGVGRKQPLPENILVPDAQGIVRINQKQLPALSSGVYVMSKTAGIIKLDSNTSKIAASGGHAVIKVAPKIGQTSIKVIKRDPSNGSKPNIITRVKQPIKPMAAKVIAHRKGPSPGILKKAEPTKIDTRPEEDESDGLEELPFPTDLPLPEPESPPGEFVLCPLTGKILGEDDKSKDATSQDMNVSSDNTTTLDNLVNLAAADILDEAPLQLKQEIDIKTEDVNNDTEPVSIESMSPECIRAEPSEPILEINKDKLEKTQTIEEALSAMEADDAPVTTSATLSTSSILSTALSIANIESTTSANVQKKVDTEAIRQKTAMNRNIINRTIVPKPAPQAIITRITPGSVNRHRLMNKSKNVAPPTTFRKAIRQTYGNKHSIIRKIGSTSVYQSSLATTSIETTQPSTTTESLVQTLSATSPPAVINMPLLTDIETPSTSTDEQIKSEPPPEPSAAPPIVEDADINPISLNDSDTPLLITGEDGTIYQVAGQNEEGQTILIAQDADGQQQCLLVASESASDLAEPEVSGVQSEISEPMEQETPISTEPEGDNGEDSQIVAQIVSAQPPSPGGTRKVVLMLPDGNLMMTEVTAEQYAALELDK